MDLKQQILHLYRVDELSLREIARRTGADRKTVTRLINAYEAAVKADPDTGIDEFLATRPKYTSRKYAPRVMRDAVAKEIDRCLKENDRRRGNGMRKQCLKNTDIHRQLMEKGLAVSYSSVCKYVRKKKSERASKGRDVYLRIHKAGFPQMKYLAELVREDLPVDGRNLLPEFETLDFIRAGRNIVMYGNPGTGKTHIAIGLGIKACMEGYTVFFTTVPHMLTLIREARTDRTLQSLESRFRKYDLVICDEMGYVSFDKEGAELLFNMISTRTGDKATIITTNLPFTRWEEIIKDKVLCSALVDRLCHKAFMVNMTGPSYRVKETQNIFKNFENKRDLLTFETDFRWPLFQIHFGGNLLYYLHIKTRKRELDHFDVKWFIFVT